MTIIFDSEEQINSFIESNCVRILYPLYAMDCSALHHDCKKCWKNAVNMVVSGKETNENL